MTAAPSALTDHLGYWLRKVSNAVSGRFAGALGARGFTACPRGPEPGVPGRKACEFTTTIA